MTGGQSIEFDEREVPTIGDHQCPECEGTGEVRVSLRDPPLYREVSAICSWCSGRGLVSLQVIARWLDEHP